MSYIPIHSSDLEQNKYQPAKVLISQLETNTLMIDNNDMEFVVLKQTAGDISKKYENVDYLGSSYRAPINIKNTPNNNDNIIKLYIGSMTVIGLFIFFRILKKSV